MSAFFAVLAAVLVADVVHRMVAGSPRISRIAGLLAGLGFGLSPLLWSQAVITEVYTLHAFFVALILWLMVSRQVVFWSQNVKRINLVWLDRLGGLIFGLALGNQITVIFLLPFWLIHDLFKEQEEHTAPSPWNLRFLANSIHWRSLVRRVIWLLLGLSVYLTIPLRARSASPVNWGNPVDWDGLWWLVSGSIYQDRVFRLELEYVWPRLRTWAGMLQNQFGLPGLAVGFYGLFYGHPKRKGFYLLTGWIMLAYSIFAIGYNSSDSYTLLLPAFLAFALWFGLGCASLLEWITGRPWGFWKLPVGIGILAVFILINAATHYSSVDASDACEADAFVETVFAAAPERAILFTQEDRDTFALWYHHYALGERPDLRVVVQPHLGYAWYCRTLESVYPDLIFPAEATLTMETFKELNRRPVCRVELEEWDSLYRTSEDAKGNSNVLDCTP
jgi:hypothetical protein